MTQYIASTPGTLAAAMGYQSQVPQSMYPTGQLALAGGGIARLPFAGGTAIGGGNYTGIPMGNRTGFGLLKKLKKRVKKLIPKEIAPIAMAAAPFMGPIAGPIAAGLGSYKTYGKINPMAMAMSLAPHIKTGGYGNWGGGKSIRGLLTGKGPTGSGQGILGNWGNKIDASIFGSPDRWETQRGIHDQIIGSHKIPGKSGIFGTGGDTIGFEDVFKTLTTNKEGKKSLDKITMIVSASASYADAIERAKSLGLGEGDLPFSNQDEYERVKASLTGEIPTYATGGRVKYANGGINNTRTGLQWGSDKGEGLGGEEVEADMRYEGGFMPYGEEPKADDVPARLSKDEFVFTDEAVAGAGDGDINLGAERLYNVMKNLEQGGRLSQESEGQTAEGIGAMV